LRGNGDDERGNGGKSLHVTVPSKRVRVRPCGTGEKLPAPAFGPAVSIANCGRSSLDAP
jgi:hypothetical protein